MNAYAALTMKLTVNGNAHQVPNGLTVRELIEHMGLLDGPVAVERNRAVVPRISHRNTSLQEGDVIEIVHFVGGG